MGINLVSISILPTKWGFYMSSTFKWIAIKAGTLLGRNVPSLFYQLIYREIYREIFDLTKNGKQTIEDSYKLGYVSAQESAERQLAVFRMFPSDPIKVLEYVPLMWQIYFGQPMGDYTTEWDHSDPIRPILTYKIKNDPMTFDMGKDPLRDNLPWDKLWYGENGYGALMSGLLTQVSSFVLKVKGRDERITLINSSNALHGDTHFEFRCQVLPTEDELPDFTFNHISASNSRSNASDSAEIKKNNEIWAKITENIDLDKLDNMMESPEGLLRVPLSNAIEKISKMPSVEFLDHFTNDEEKIIQILGFIGIHLSNEWGQLPETFFKNKSFAKVYAHIFLFMKNNAEKFIPVNIIGEFKGYLSAVFEGMAPETFVTNLQNIPEKKVLDLFFLGVEKALKDLGIDFSTLKPSLYEEFKTHNVKESEKSAYDQGQQEKKDLLIAQLVDQMMIISTAILSIPSQMAMVLIYKVISSSGSLFSSLFKTIRDSGQQIIELSDKLKEFN